MLFMKLLELPIFRLFSKSYNAWIQIEQRIFYNILSIIYKTLQSHKPYYLHNVLHIQ